MYLKKTQNKAFEILHSWLNTILSLFSECLAGYYGEIVTIFVDIVWMREHHHGMCDEECDPGYQTPLCTEGDDNCTNTFDKYYICFEL